MEKLEVANALNILGLKVPEAECGEIADAFKFLENMVTSVRRPRPISTNPGHEISFLEN